jgi:hypothetical protein
MKKFLIYGATLTALGTANAADEITPPIGNYAGVLEANRAIYPHPTGPAPAPVAEHELYEHPAVTVAKRASAPRPVVTLHPALWH